MSKKIVIATIIMCGSLFAQPTHSFDLQDTIGIGPLNFLTVSSGGKFYSCLQSDPLSGSLIVFDYTDSISIVRYKGTLSVNTHAVCEGPDEILFVAEDTMGLRAYKQHDDSLSLVSSIRNGGQAFDVTTDQNGYVYLANGHDGLRVYAYDVADSVFTNTAHINNQTTMCKLTIGADGTLFVASLEDGLYAYNYDVEDSVFTMIGHVNDGGSAKDVEIRSDGLIFLANGEDGLRAYTFDGINFSNLAHASYDDGGLEEIDVGPDGSILATANRLQAWTYNPSFGFYLAASFTGGTINRPIYYPALELAIRSDSIVLATDGHSLHAYEYYDMGWFVGTGETLIPGTFSISQNHPNPFNPATTISYDLPEQTQVNLTVYDVMGRELRCKSY